MRKNYLFLMLFLFGIVSCSQDQAVDEDLEFREKTEQKTAMDGKYDVLGFGYDITMDFLAPAAYTEKGRVVNVDVFVKNNASRFYEHGLGEIDSRFYGGSDAITFISDIKKETHFDGSAASKALDSKPNQFPFTGSIERTSDIQVASTYSSKYSFAKGYSYKETKRLYLDAVANDLIPYLTDNFTTDLNTMSADKLVLKYGTHVLGGFKLGGHYVCDYKSAVVDETVTTNMKQSVKAGAEITMMGAGITVNSSQSMTLLISQNRKNSKWESKITCLGGTTTGRSYSYNSETGVTQIGDNPGVWESSVTPTSSIVIEFDWNRTFPIYDLVKDQTKKRLLKAAVDKYIADRQINVIKVKPLYQYHIGGNCFYYDTAIRSDYGDRNWNPVCYVQDDSKNNAVPLYQYYQGSNRFYYDTSPNANYGNRNGIVCYINKEKVKGTVPLYQYHIGSNRFYYDTAIRYDYGTNTGIVGYVYSAE